MEKLWQDIKFGVRMLANKPGVTVIAILALAVGIGASTAIFSVVNSVLLEPLPYANANRLVVVWENNRRRSRERNVINPANFQDWREQNNVFQDMAAFFTTPLNITGIGEPEEIAAMATSPNLFDVLGEPAMLGRTFTAEDGVRGKDNVAVLSYASWQKHFGADPNVIGKTFGLNGETITVVGVMPDRFHFFIKEWANVKRSPELWVPLVFNPSRTRQGRFLNSVGVLKPGVSVDQARSEMNALGARLEQQYPDFNKGWGITLVPLRQQLSGELRPALLLLMGAVGFVLLIACANVANLLLARAVTRQKEFAIRTALGAGRLRLIRQLLTESLLLSMTACAIGLLLARWGIDTLLAISPRGLLSVPDVSLDRRVLLFAIVTSVLTSLIFGLMPALESSRPQTGDALKEGGRGTTRGRSHRILNGFVVAQVAFSMILLVGSGLMIKSLRQLQAVDPGYDPTNVVTAAISLPRAKYNDAPKTLTFFQQLLARTRQLPGVKSAGMATAPPFTNPGSATGFEIEGQPPLPVSQRPGTGVRAIDQDYFRTMNIPLLQGRNFAEHEVLKESHVVIVSDALVKKHFPNENPLGKRITINMKDEDVPSEIIGVVGDVKWTGLDQVPTAMSYWPHAELPSTSMTLVVRSDGDPAALAAALQREVKALDKDQPISEVSPMTTLMADSYSRSQFAGVLLSIFAIVALVLASVGIYGVMSYSVTQRTNEIGIRMALGASRQSVLGLMLKRGAFLAATGLVIGLLGSFALTRLLTNLLFGVSAMDPFTFAAAPIVLGVLALIATYLPARRATKVDPLVALRYE